MSGVTFHLIYKPDIQNKKNKPDILYNFPSIKIVDAYWPHDLCPKPTDLPDHSI